MPDYRDQQRVACSAERMFATIADIESYPCFLPGWRAARIRSHGAGRLDVEQKVGLGPLEWRFLSQAVLDPPGALRIVSRQAPFSRLEVTWHVRPEGDKSCFVSLAVAVECSVAPAGRLLERLLPASAAGLIRLFAERALAGTGSASGERTAAASGRMPRGLAGRPARQR